MGARISKVSQLGTVQSDNQNQQFTAVGSWSFAIKSPLEMDIKWPFNPCTSLRTSRAPRCVALTRTRSWKTIDCEQRLPFICEINTSGPDKRVSLKGQCNVKRANNKNLWTDPNWIRRFIYEPFLITQTRLTMWEWETETKVWSDDEDDVMEWLFLSANSNPFCSVRYNLQISYYSLFLTSIIAR